MQAPKISIITPSFNQAQYIEQTIDSVLSQGYPNLEYVIVDGGSKDGSVEIIKKYEKHLAYWVSEPDHGQSDAINKGLHKVSGDVVNWLNSDDYFAPDSLHYIGEVFANPATNVLCGTSRKFSDNQEVFTNGTDVYDSNLAKTIGWARIDQPETFFRKAAYDAVGPVSVDLHYLMDREWWVRYLLRYGLTGIRKSDKVLVNFRWHPGSKTVSQAEAFQSDHDAIFASLAEQAIGTELGATIRQLFKTNPKYRFPYFPVAKELVNDVFMYYFLFRAHELYYFGETEKSRQILGHVKSESLTGEDLQLYNRLRFRSAPVVSGILKALKAWRRK